MLLPYLVWVSAVTPSAEFEVHQMPLLHLCFVAPVVGASLTDVFAADDVVAAVARCC